MKQNQVQQKEIRLGTHGEHYGSWMSNPVFYVIGALLALSVVLAVLSFAVFHITALGVVFVIAAVILLALLLWCAWIRRQYAFGGGGMMDRTHLVVLSHLDFDGQGQLLEVGCGSGPLSIRAALLETLRVLKKGGVFAINDNMKPRAYGDMEAFAQELRDMGYEDVRLIDTTQEAFGSRRRAAMMMLGDSRMLAGRK